VIKSRRIQRVWGREQEYTGFCQGNLRERHYLGNPGVDGMIILRWVFAK
jgi:hypothetical protein